MSHLLASWSAVAAALTVRNVHAEEHQALAELTLAAYRGLLGHDLDPGYAAELADVAGRAGVVDVLVAVDGGGAILGGIAYIAGPGPLAWFDGPDDAGVRMLAVAPGAQRRGVGAALIAATVQRAAAAGKRRVLLHTTDSMAGARRLYERAGFTRDPDHDRLLEGGLQLVAYARELDRER